MAIRAFIVVLCLAFATMLVIAATGDDRAEHGMHGGHGSHAMHQDGGGGS